MLKKLVLKVYRIAVFTRHDEDGSTYQYSADDFCGLIADPFVFKNPFEDKLHGAFYYYEGYRRDRLIVFDHGMGVGHSSYMKEIEMLARHGFKVFAYDHTGCTHSEGESIRGLSGSVADLDACISALKAIPELCDVKISVVGHSWGGFSAMNITAFHKDIHSVVAMSGFISLKDMLRQEMHGLIGPLRFIPYRYECEKNGKYALVSAQKTLLGTEAPTLIIHSDDDDTVSFRKHFLKLYRLVSKKTESYKNVKMVRIHGKLHNPNYTEDAVRYKKQLYYDIMHKRRHGELSTAEQREKFKGLWDWDRMTAQDPEIWEMIFEHLDK